MKVVLLAPTPPPRGGIAGWTKRMMDAQLKNGWGVIVVDEKVTGKRDAYDGSKKNYFNEAKRCLRIWGDLNKALKNKEAKVVQACIPAETTSMLREIISAIISKIHRRKFIVHFRCTVPNMVKSKSGNITLKIMLCLSDCVFVLNKASEDFVKSINSKKKVKTIPNFIELKDVKEKENYNTELKNLLYVGGVIEEKGCGLIAETARKFPKKSFKLIGNVDMDVSDFPENVILLGEQPKEIVQKELDLTDAFLFLTHYRGEGFSNALAEAMSKSLPCLVSNWAANADMIENKGGVILKDNNVNAVVDAIYKIENYDVRREMGNWNYNKVINSYSDKVVLDMYVDEYEDLVHK